MHGHPGQAARRAISSAVREIGDLPRESFSLIVPARHGQSVLGGMLERLAPGPTPAR